MTEPVATSAALTPAGEVRLDGDHATLIFVRELPHPPEVVWKALTDEQQFCMWFATTARIEARVGGIVDMVSGPSQMRWTGHILTWEPPHVFEYDWNIAPRPEMPHGEATIVRWELAASAAGTTLTLTHRHLSTPTALGFAPGTHTFLDRLAAHLDQTALPNWTLRYGAVQHLYPSWKQAG